MTHSAASSSPPHRFRIESRDRDEAGMRPRARRRRARPRIRGSRPRRHGHEPPAAVANACISATQAWTSAVERPVVATPGAEF